MRHIISSLLYERSINAAVMFGVLCTAAVLTGALLVGDSMQYSLKQLTLKRLGAVDTILFAPDFINENLKSPEYAVPVIYLSGAAEYNGKTSSTQILALPDTARKPLGLGFTDIPAVNQALADKLQIKSGGEISLRFLSPQAVPPESTFGRKDNLIRAKITVERIIPNEGIGRFSLKNEQQPEPLLLVPLDWLQKKLDVGEKVNAVFYFNHTFSDELSDKQRNRITETFRPAADDLGININGKYITSKRMLFTAAQAECLDAAFRQQCNAGLLYLATSIKALKNGCEIPYSTVFASNSSESSFSESSFSEPSMKRSESGSKNIDELNIDELNTDGLKDNEIALNEWAANDLQVSAGDEIELTWFSPDNVSEIKSQKFTLAKIVPDNTFTNDVVPDVKGFTDEQTIAGWDPPFPFDAKKIRKADEEYWDKYKAAPKAFINLETGQKLWGSRFGNVSTFILNSGDLPLQTVQQTAQQTILQAVSADDLSAFNLNFVPVRKNGLAASQGTTPFSVLFLCFSFFIIASALMLTAMLFRLSVEMKAKQIGIRLACGWSYRQVLHLLLTQAFILCITGSFFGVLLGILYAQIMIYALTTFWLDAVSVPFLHLSVNPVSLLAGFSGGTSAAMCVIVWTLRSCKRIPVRTLLSGGFTPLPFFKKRRRNGEVRKKLNTFLNTPLFSSPQHLKEKKEVEFGVFWFGDINRHPRAGFITFSICFLLQCIALYSINHNSVIFFIYAASFLFFAIMIFSRLLENNNSGVLQFRSLAGLSQANIRRNRLRSILCVGLVASTVFLVLSVSAFRLDPNTETKYRFGGSGSGGFDSLAETAFPVGCNINTPEGRAELGLQEKEEQIYAAQQMDVVPVRTTGGDNAGCLNLYQTGNPRILGIPCGRLVQRKEKHLGEFRFAVPERKSYESTPWSDLHNRSVSVDPDGVKRVPVILERNTAMYSFHLYKGIGEVYELSYNNETIRYEVIALLSNSVLQGRILMSEVNFKTLFPDISGYRLFLIGKTEPKTLVPKTQMPEWYALFDKMLADYGVQTETSADLLRRHFAVQNTYISAFQSLGGIGLLLGIFGLAVIQVRNVFERRKELALFQAIGFRQSRLILLLLYENFVLLFWGLLSAVFASFFALLPFLLDSPQEISAESVLRQFVYLTGGMIAVAFISNIAAAMSVLKIPAAKELSEER